MPAPLNPFRITGTVLPPPLLLMARLVVLAMPGPPMPAPLLAGFALGAAALFLTPFVRAASLLLAAVAVLNVVTAPRALAIQLYPAVLLLVAGNLPPEHGPDFLEEPCLAPRLSRGRVERRLAAYRLPLV